MQKYESALKWVRKEADAESFSTYVMNSDLNQAALFENIKACKVDEIKTRFNIWRMVLGIMGINSSPQQKIQQIKRSREEYSKKKSEALGGFVDKKQTKIVKNPLMKAMMKAPKQQESNDELLREDIKKDVERTYQEMHFFQEECILKLLSTILLVWCKKNVAYQQGMNEVLASIVFVYFSEVYSPKRQPDNFASLSENEKQIYVMFNSIEFCEADVYHVFERVMNVQQEMYKTETDSSLKGVINPNSKNNTPILQRIITLIDQKLKLLDIQLFRAIKLQDVQTKTFLLRWIRCMHTREFTLENSFLIWDSIFLDYYENPSSRQKNVFEFIDAMCLAMFIYMRSIALTRETAYEIQQIYQKYPQLKKGGYLEELISLAWSLCEALRNSAGGETNSDWYAQESSQVDNKLQFMKGKEISQKAPQIKQESPKKFPEPSPTLAQKNSKKEEKPQEESQPVQIVPKQVEVVKQSNSTNNGVPENVPQKISIQLEYDEWMSIHDNIANSLHQSTQPQVKELLQASMNLLQKKVIQARNK